MSAAEKMRSRLHAMTTPDLNAYTMLMTQVFKRATGERKEDARIALAMMQAEQARRAA